MEANQSCQRNSPPPVAVQEAEGSSQVANLPIPLFTPQTYILIEDRLVTVEKTALGDSGVAFALAHSLTLPNDRRHLEDVETLDLGAISFQCLITISFSVPFCLHIIFFSFVIFPLLIYIIFLAICSALCRALYLANQGLKQKEFIL